MVQKDLMSVLMFIEDTTLAATGHSQEVRVKRIIRVSLKYLADMSFLLFSEAEKDRDL